MSFLKRPTSISTTIRKKKTANKYYDPINRIGENIVARLGGEDRLGNLYEGDTLLTDATESPTGHINMVHHIITLPSPGADALKALKNYTYFGSLQVAQPKLNEMIQKNPSQNKETVPAQKTSFVLSDVHTDDVGKSYKIGEILYATPEVAPDEYNGLKTAGVPYRMVLAHFPTFNSVMEKLTGKTPVDPDDMKELKEKYAVGRAHNGKKAGYGNCYYTIRY